MLKNTTLKTVNITLQGRSKSSSEEETFIKLLVECDTTGHVPIIEPLEEKNEDEDEDQKKVVLGGHWGSSWETNGEGGGSNSVR